MTVCSIRKMAPRQHGVHCRTGEARLGVTGVDVSQGVGGDEQAGASARGPCPSLPGLTLQACSRILDGAFQARNINVAEYAGEDAFAEPMIIAATCASQPTLTAKALGDTDGRVSGAWVVVSSATHIPYPPPALT